MSNNAGKKDKPAPGVNRQEQDREGPLHAFIPRTMPVGSSAATRIAGMTLSTGRVPHSAYIDSALLPESIL